MRTLTEHLSIAINEKQYPLYSTWENDIPGFRPIFNNLRTPQAYFEFMTDKHTFVSLIKEIHYCPEDFSIEIPMECIKMLGDFRYKDLQKAWELYVDSKDDDDLQNDEIEFVNNLSDSFKVAWKKDSKYIDNAIKNADDDSAYKLKSIAKNIDLILKQSLLRNINLNTIFENNELNIDTIVKQNKQIQSLLKEFHKIAKES